MRTDLNKINNETVSVIMAVYNCEKTVGEAIESILNQTYQDIQLIICDDCSVDNTAEIVQRYADANPEKIVFICNKKNMKLPFSLNHCLEHATGKYIARMDGDDYSYPTRIETQVNYLKEHSDIDLVGTAMEIFNGKEATGIVKKAKRPERIDFIKTNVFSHATILTYKYVYDELGGYSLLERAVRVEDYDLWIRFCKAGFIGENIDDVCYRVLEDENTIGRRKFKDRVNGYKTAKFGVEVLALPRKCMIGSVISLLIGLIPKPIYTLLHRLKYQK